MVSSKACRASGLHLLIGLAVTFLGVAVVAQPMRAADSTPADFSARLVPADASFYHAFLHNREQIEIVRKSRAVAALKELPAVQMLKKAIQNQLENKTPGWGMVKKQLEQKEVREALDFLRDALAHEVFFYAGPNCADCTALFLHLSNAMRFAGLPPGKPGEGQLTDNQRVAAALLRALNQHRDLIKVPDLMLGFKVSDAQKAQAMVDKLAGILEGAAENLEPLKGRIQRVKVGESNFLAVTVDGTMVPWDRIPIDDVARTPGEFKPLMKKLQGLKLVHSIGVRNGYLLLALGDSTARLARFGGPGKHLTDLPEFKRLSKAGGRPLTSVSYASKAFLTRIMTVAQDFQGMLNALKQAIPPDVLTAEQRQRLEKDFQALVKDIKAYQPKPGAALSFTFLTGHGFEGYSYDWSTHLPLEGSKPLPLLNHLGGSPLLAAVMRGKHSPEQYQLLVKWMKVALGYVDELLVPKLDESKKKEYEKWSAALRPLAKRLDEITATKLVPALADGQHGFVLDAKWSSKQWCPKMPAASRPLPMFEIGLLLGVSDASLFEQAVNGYLSLLDDALAKVRELRPNEVPPFKIPRPQLRNLEQGKIAFWPLPEILRLDPRIGLTGGLSDSVAVLAASQQHAERLLKDTPHKAGSLKESKLLTEIDKRPLVGAFFLDGPGLVNALLPWVDYGITLYSQKKAEGDAEKAKKDAQMMRDHVKVLSAVLRTFRGAVGLMYFEDGALVQHGEVIFRDLPPAKVSKPQP